MLSLLEAIERKYGVLDEDDSSSTEADIAIFVPKRHPRLCIPSLLVLNDFDISTAGDGGQLANQCSGVEELDLAMNKLERWSEVFSIFSHMPRLKFANLSFNSLSGPLDHHNRINVSSWTNLRNLVLNSTNIDWKSVRELLNFLPELEELHLSFNEYSNVEIIDFLHNIDNERDSNKYHCCGQEDMKEFVTSKVSKDEVPCSSYSHNFTNDDENENCEHGCRNGQKECTYCKVISDDSNRQLNGEKSNDENNCDGTRKQCDCDKSGRNVYKRLDSLCSKIQHAGVKKLHFSGNHVSTWNEICKLGIAFPNLESLVVAECPIETLDINTSSDNETEDEKCRKHSKTESECESSVRSESPHNDFCNLEFLNLNCTRLSTWDDIERLAKFPKLQCLRIQGCPLWESSESTQHERRQLLVARLPNVCILNGGGVIGAEEREDAERAFIRHYMDKPEHLRPERYSELVNKHGHLDPLVNVDLRPEKHVRITFIYKDITEVKSVNVYRTVADLKTRLETMTGLPASRMKLYYLDKDMKGIQGAEEMKYPSKQLYRYNVQSGDEILIDCKKQRTISSSSTDKNNV